jgi:flavorubredoxin
VNQDIYVLSSSYHIPRFGTIPVNAYVILSQEPVLVDAGLGRDREEFLKAIEKIIDPADIKWIWLTHDDLDHAGNVQQLLQVAPNAKLAMHMLAAFRMNTGWQVPLERVHVLSLDEKIDVGDRKLIPIRPPLYDAPYTIGLFDEKLGALFSVDAFGAVLKRKERDVTGFSEKELADGMTIWASIDSPWIHMIDEQKYRIMLNQVQQLNPKLILSSHLPTARDKTSQLLEVLSHVPSSKPFTTPNQQVFSKIMIESEEIFTY